MIRLKQRLFFADFARVAATVAVIAIHCSGQLTMQYGEVSTAFWQTGIFFNSIFRWSVDIFIMISGFFLLQPSDGETTRQFFRKRFSRVVVPFLAWSVIYTIYKFDSSIFIYHIIPWRDIRQNIIYGEVFYHLWFVSMIIGLYLLTPFLRIFTAHASKRDLEYFLVLWLVLDTWSLYCSSCIVVKYLGWMAYVGVFVLGFYLSKYDIRKSLLPFLFVSGFIITFFGTFYLTSFNHRFTDYLFYYLSPNVLAMSVAVFEWIKKTDWEKKWSPARRHFIHRISQWSFSIYLIHALWIDWLKNGYVGLKMYNNYFMNDSLHPVIAVPVMVAVVMILSTISIWIISKIPVMNKLFL